MFLSLCIAAAIRVQFLEVLELRAAFLTFYPAVAIAALYGGFGAGLLATVVSAALADYFWMEPVRQFAITNSADLISIVVFLASGALISYLAEAAYQAQARAYKAEEQSRLAAERKHAEASLTADLNALTRMHALSGRLLETGGIQPLLQEIMDAAVSIVGAEMGTLQLLEGDSLRIVAAYGHFRPFLEFFASAENLASVCGEATKRGERVVVSDVETSSLFIGTPSLAVLREAGVRAVQSTPVMSRNGALLGILTTQWGIPYTPDERDLWRIDLLVRQASDLIENSIAEQALRESEERLQAELDAMTRLHQIGTLFAHEGNMENVLGEIVEAAIAISGADFGNIQLLDTQSSTLKIVAQRRLPKWWVDFWNEVSEGHGVCGTALVRGERVIVEDVEQSPIFVGTPALEIQLKAGVRAVQSTPLIGRSGKPLGMFSTHYKAPHRPDGRALRLLDLLARQAADIIERAQTEANLRESGQRFRVAQELSPDGFTILRPVRDTVGRVVDFTWVYENDTIARLNGTDPESVVGKRLLELFPGHASSPFLEAYKHAAETGETRILEAFYHGDSILTPTWFRIAVVSMEKDIAILAQDITERKQAEETLRESEAKLQAALASIPDAVFISDAEGRLVNFNDAFGIYHRFRSKDECSRSIADCPTYLDAYMADGHPAPPEMWAIPRALRGERVTNTEYTLRRKDTGESWVGSYSFSPIRDKDDVIIGSVVVARDITEQQKMKEELRKSRDELELRVLERTAELSTAGDNLRKQAALLDLAHDAILVRDMDNKILYWNDGAEKTYGWTKDEALGKAAHTLLHTHFPKPMEELSDDLLKSGQWEGELCHLTKGGDQIVVASRWAIQKDADGSPTGMLEINRDITPRKKAEEQLASYMAKIEESNQALQDFAYIAAHDMKEPLRKVIAFGNMLRQKSGDSLGQSGNDYLHRMLNATARMQSLLAGLLDYSRVAAAAEPFKVVNLSDLIGEVLSDLEVRIVKTGGEVRVGDLPVISADPTQMRQLFQNLIGNALKFHKPGEKPMIQVRSVSNADSGYEILVEDNGIGFEEQYLERIFAPFQRLHGRSEYEGTGMGLAICKKIAERHGGSITASSEPGKGSSFLIMLPQGPLAVQRVWNNAIRA